MNLKLIWLLLLLAVCPLRAADVYLGNKTVITTFHPTTNYILIIMGQGTNAVYRLVNPSNLVHGIELGGSTFSTVFVSNGVKRLRQLIPSTTTTQQIDVAAGPVAYYWTNMVTNVVLQFTNIFVASVSNSPIDFFFTGATNNGPNYTVTFTCPNPAGVDFRWGLYSASNGLTSVTVTNNARLGASLTAWDTNLVEVYYSPVR